MAQHPAAKIPEILASNNAEHNEASCNQIEAFMETDHAKRNEPERNFSRLGRLEGFVDKFIICEILQNIPNTVRSSRYLYNPYIAANPFYIPKAVFKVGSLLNPSLLMRYGRPAGFVQSPNVRDAICGSLRA